LQYYYFLKRNPPKIRDPNDGFFDDFGCVSDGAAWLLDALGCLKDELLLCCTGALLGSTCAPDGAAWLTDARSILRDDRLGCSTCSPNGSAAVLDDPGWLKDALGSLRDDLLGWTTDGSAWLPVASPGTEKTSPIASAYIIDASKELVVLLRLDPDDPPEPVRIRSFSSAAAAFCASTFHICVS
jgi:hypothetical protein